MSKLIHKIRQRMKGWVALYVSFLLVLCAVAQIEVPQWWTAREVLIDPTAQPGEYDDFAPVNLGQLKNIAKHAYDECIEKGLPQNTQHDLLIAQLNPWLAEDAQFNDKIANVGQVKNLGQLFHNWLGSSGYVNYMAFTSEGDEYAAANVGQVKNVFNFDPFSQLDSDGDGIPDWWEIAHGLDPFNPDDWNVDIDGDGFFAFYEYHSGTFENDDGSSPTASIFVDDVEVNGDGSKAYPFNKIQDALDAANDYDVIQLADGTYKGEGNRDLDYLGKPITIISESGYTNCIIDCENAARGFVFDDGERSSSLLLGVTVKNGRAPYSSQYDSFVLNGCGGAVYAFNAFPTIRDCKLINNRANRGGGIFCYISAQISSSLIVNISDCLIEENVGSYSAGGIHVYNTTLDEALCTVKISGCVISNNVTGVHRGGSGVYVQYASASMRNCKFFNNRGDFGASFYSAAHIENCDFVGNSRGIRISLGGGEAYVKNCLFENNDRGAIQVLHSSAGREEPPFHMTISNCKIHQNGNKYYRDTMIYIYGDGYYTTTPSHVVIEGCSIVNNYGHAIYNGNAYLEISDSTIAFNKFNPDDGGRKYGAILLYTYTCESETLIRNSIISNNKPAENQIWAPLLGTCRIENSCYNSTHTDDVVNNTTIYNCLQVDPKLCVESPHLQASSPCIDRATGHTSSGTDINGEPRHWGAGVDIGCDEFVDTDEDGMADWFERKYLAEYYASQKGGDAE